jgi:hypothetical protein
MSKLIGYSKKSKMNVMKMLNIVARLQSEQNRRILPKFDEDENIAISNNINRLVNYLMKKIIECEDNIKKLSQVSGLGISEMASIYFL